MDVLGTEFFGFKAGKFRVRLYVLVGYGGAFLHHVSEVAGHRHHALASTYGTLHEKDLSAELGPGETGHDTGSFIALLEVVVVGRQAEILFQVILLYHGGIVLSEGYLLGSDPGNLGYLLLKATDPGLVGIFIDDCGKRRLVNPEFLAADPMLLKLLGHEVTLGDLHLLFGQVAGYVDQLHPVEKG